MSPKDCGCGGGHQVRVLGVVVRVPGCLGVLGAGQSHRCHLRTVGVEGSPGQGTGCSGQRTGLFRGTGGWVVT